MNQRGEAFIWIMVICCVLTFVLLIGGAMWMDSAVCSSKWAKSGFATSWGPMQGCNIKLPNGKWIPASNYREIDP